MIPEFPNFKKIELSDKEDVEKFTRQYPPYSDFNFVSMWSWDIKEEMRISQLNNNLVVRFNDYMTGEPFYSYLGNNKINETAKELLDFSIEEKEIHPKLILISDDIIRNISKDRFKSEEDLDNFDYIYDLNQIITYKGSQFLEKRNKVNIFLKRTPNSRIEIMDLENKISQQKIIDLDEFWFKNKIEKDLNFKTKNELLATKRFFEANFKDSLGVGLYVDDKLIGYSIFSILSHQKYAISHFCKADTNFKGVYDYLVQECAKILVGKGCLYLNYEQDLGLPGLRVNKKSFMSKFLKKHTVSIL